jgi:Cu+-exporting ATPase
VRPEARGVVSELARRSLRSVMITGDSEDAAGEVAREAGIGELHARVLPGDKLRRVAALRSGGGIVAMVGDGINDAPALAEADVGIAMGSGADAAMHAADITLMRPDLRLVPLAIDLSRATIRTIRQNLFWAFGYNVVCIPLAAFGLLNPMLAAAAMAFSSVSVVGNALLLKRFASNRQPGGSAGLR